MTLPPAGRIVLLNDEPPADPLYDGDRGACRLRWRHRRERGMAWSSVRDCLVESGVRSFDEIPPTGPYMPPEVMPLNFSEAPGGWLIAHLNGDQELAVFFYGSAAQAERAKDEALHFPDAMAVSRRGSVLYGFVRRRHLSRSALPSIALRLRPAREAVVLEKPAYGIRPSSRATTARALRCGACGRLSSCTWRASRSFSSGCPRSFLPGGWPRCCSSPELRSFARGSRPRSGATGSKGVAEQVERRRLPLPAAERLSRFSRRRDFGCVAPSSA
jgi:hypothetical protein